ncbi:MAG: YfiH family protein [Oceanospirillaceae bacterium]|jgi:YfiH family protein
MQVVKANWPELENSTGTQVTAFTTTRLFGVSEAPFQSFNTGFHVNDDPKAVLTNRQSLLEYCGLQDAQWLNQVHGTSCIKSARDNQVVSADACWTDEAELACIVMTADCLPVAFRESNKIAVAHAGWRGLLSGVLQNTLQNFNTQETDVWLGPAIGSNAFEVGAEVREQFLDKNQAYSTAFIAGDQPGKWLADIYELARLALIMKGVNSARIYSGNYCTFTDEKQFYSYRRQAQTGRMATVIYRTILD